MHILLDEVNNTSAEIIIHNFTISLMRYTSVCLCYLKQIENHVTGVSEYNIVWTHLTVDLLVHFEHPWL